MITAQQVKELRDKTLASVSDCKKALEESGGDFVKAQEILRRRGKQVAEKRAGKETRQGIIEYYVHSNKKIGALVELNCETDFVAKNDKFRELAHDIALHVASMNPQYLEAADIPQEVLEKKRNEFMEEIKNSGKPEAVQKQILEGKMKKFSEEISLLEQPFVKNPDEKIKDLVNEYTGKIGENIKIGKFIRLEIL
ncbi:MAG: translation elongation factor Ts [Candidatus Portnoybacteria bacterium RBG_19FT_COMBO_36_7]|uniref:Elongation factor Ts n=1 Tax=Candidatus Portnoybacteria bacterium RBG_19FT_COMBO_36_7 TaxID=1801992 RepID=A0A1G2F8L5_9BACT|nr:MAG: translation elongation factor Ts [Candidatus Portnoybacteria bacterium RBG_19FT_COMBO_36_7]